MTYTIHCISTSEGWRWYVALWRGRTAYKGMRTYKNYGCAVRAARATGATEQETI